MTYKWLRSMFAVVLSLTLGTTVFADGEKGAVKGPADGQGQANKGPGDGQGPANKGPRDGQGPGKGGERGPGGPGGNGPGREAMMKKFDKNGDGQLDDTEKAAARAAMGERGSKPGEGAMSPERREAFMKKFDKNGDGKLDDTERSAAKAEFEKMRGGERKPGAGKPGEGKPGEGRGGDFMKKFDKNGDGKLDENEKAAAKEAMAKLRGAGDKPGPKPNGDQPGAKKPETN